MRSPIFSNPKARCNLFLFQVFETNCLLDRSPFLRNCVVFVQYDCFIVIEIDALCRSAHLVERDRSHFCVCFVANQFDVDSLAICSPPLPFCPASALLTRSLLQHHVHRMYSPFMSTFGVLVTATTVAFSPHPIQTQSTLAYFLFFSLSASLSCFCRISDSLGHFRLTAVICTFAASLTSSSSSLLRFSSALNLHFPL